MIDAWELPPPNRLERLSRWLWQRYRPRDGWLPFWMLAATLYLAAFSVAQAEWTPESHVVMGATLTGAALAYAWRRWRVGWAWGCLALGGMVYVIMAVGRVWPPPAVWWAGWEPARQHAGQALALLLDRAQGWLIAVQTGGRSQETLIFTLCLGYVAWLVSAFTVWSAYRAYRPWPAVTVLAGGVAGSAYFANTPLTMPALCLASLTFFLAALRDAALRAEWEQRGVDYSPEIRLDMLLASGAVMLGLLLFSVTLPSLPYTELARALQNSPAVERVSHEFTRLSGVLAQRRLDSGAALTSPAAQSGGEGVLPNAFLSGNPPELARTLVFSATLTWPSAARPVVSHWRTGSFDEYTGHGWARSEERVADVAPSTHLPTPVYSATVTLTQQVRWLLDDKRIIYPTVGTPLRLSPAVMAHWRGVDDLVYVDGEQRAYQALSVVSLADGQLLRRAVEAETPPALLARYTALPPIPDRVRALARSVVDSQPTPYDQAVALERFLRQYPYSLDVSPPPRTTDVVDYFLFELQRGYCDYYASAMVVMARSLDLPARLALGYTTAPPDAEGVQRVYQIQSHAWAEIYFPTYGWVEFEPTAGLDVPERAAPISDAVDLSLAPPPPAPTPRARSWLVGAALLGGGLLAVIGWQLWRRRSAMKVEDAAHLYGALQRLMAPLGVEIRASQTPLEWEARVLDCLADGSSVEVKAATQVHRLNVLLVGLMYGRDKTELLWLSAEKLFRQTRPALRRLGWRRRLRGPRLL